MTKLIRLLLIISLTGRSVAFEKGACCPDEQRIVRKNDIPILCVDTKTNITTKLTVTCEDPIEIYATGDTDFHVNDTGSLIMVENQETYDHEPGTFCVYNGSMSDPSGVSSDSDLRVALVCGFVEEISDSNKETIFGSFLMISAILLFGTACIYMALPELRDLQGKSIVNFCLSLGFFTYYFCIVAFFWSNAISVQILLSTRHPTQSTYGWKEFAWYAIYAWGCPSIITIAMAIVNFMPGKHRKPGIGLNHCWFYDTKLQWEYMYSVMSILILTNICIFIYVSIFLWRQSFTSSSHLQAVRHK